MKGEIWLFIVHIRVKAVLGTQLGDDGVNKGAGQLGEGDDDCYIRMAVCCSFNKTENPQLMLNLQAFYIVSDMKD